nr:hypothetical protein [Actinopolymorpha cephalotaxi]
MLLTEDPWPEKEPGDEEPKSPPELGDGVTAGRVASDAHLVPGLWKVDGYTKIGDFLRRRFDLADGENYFELPYDWRRDNRAAAHQLALSSRIWLAKRREQYPDAKLVLVGHSMGGLVSRYFLEVLGGWRDTRRLITFGTPYRGSLNAVEFVAHGFKKFFGLVDLTELMCSFTSVHQLLPIYRCVEVGKDKMARLTEVPEVLPRLTPQQIASARAFHSEIEDAVARHLQDDEYRERGYQVRPVVGIEQPTNQSAVWARGRLEILRTYGDKDLGGDGTVPRVSASPQEANSDATAMFSSDKHASLQNADGVHTQLRGWMQNINLGDFKFIAPVTVKVDIAEVHRQGEPAPLLLSPTWATLAVRASLTYVGGPGAEAEPQSAVEIPVLDGVQEVALPTGAPGVYRLRVEGDEIEPVTDLLVVAPA